MARERVGYKSEEGHADLISALEELRERRGVMANLDDIEWGHGEVGHVGTASGCATIIECVDPERGD